MSRSSTTGPEPKAGAGARFDQTHWSVVLTACNANEPARSAALETLCRTYWEPIYSFLRRSGVGIEDAQDLTQSFLAHLVQQNRLKTTTPQRGKFRSFILAALKNYLNDAWDRAQALKRGGGSFQLSLDHRSAESHLALEAATNPPPETLFDRRWAAMVMNRAFMRLQNEWLRTGKAEQFLELSVFLGMEGNATEYEAVANRLGMTRGAVAVAVHRFRQTYRDMLRSEVAQTVASQEDLDAEMNHLLEVICQ